MLLAKLQAKVPSVQTPSLDVWRSASTPGAFANLRQRPAVTDSEELRRVLALDRRAQVDLDGSLRARGLVQLMNDRLGRKNDNCKCASMNRQCFKTLLPVQAWSLYEAPLVGGMLGAIGAGSGKTGLDILMPMVFPNCKLAVLLIPPGLKQQLWDDYQLWKEHFKVPSLVMEGRGNIIAGRPVLHVVPYSRLSLPDSTDMITKLNPDLILSDECFPGEALITTKSGSVAIRDIKVGTEVMSYNPTTSRFECKRVLRHIVKQGKRPLVRVHHERGSFVCTTNHKIWTEGSGYVEAGKLEKGDRLRGVWQNLHPEVCSGSQSKTGVLGCVRFRDENEGSSRVLSLWQDCEDTLPSNMLHEVLRSGTDGGSTSWTAEGYETHQVSYVQQGSLEAQGRQANPPILLSRLFAELAGSERTSAKADQACYSGYSCLRGVRQDLRMQEERKVHGDALLPSVCLEEGRGRYSKDSHGGASTRHREADAREQSDKALGCDCEDRRILEGSDIPGTRWQWSTDHSSASTGETSEATDRVVGFDCPGEGSLSFSTACVQGRPGCSECAIGDRDRWCIAQDQEVAFLGSSQGVDSFVSRVDRVEVLERRGVEGGGPGSGDDSLYDLEVEDNHNYVAEGIVVSNCHRLKDRRAAGASRIFRYGAENPDTRFCFWSGTITDHSINDYAHLAAYALREKSPLPLDPAIVEEWALAIDPSLLSSPAGALRKLCRQGETLYSGIHRRLVETRGVIATKEGAIGASLTLNERKVRVPTEITKLLENLRKTWQRPDGEELIQATDVAANARHIASGFWYRWIFPREPRGVDGKILPEGIARIERWFAARKAWNKELRQKLLRAEEFLDSPKNCASAAQRSLEGYEGELPVWESETWEAWSKIKDTVYHETEAVWVDDFLARDAAEWARKNLGPVWFEYQALGAKIAELSGLPLFGADSEAEILAEKGDRSIIVSIKAHGTGRDGLQRIYNNQLVANPPSSGRTFEQLFARLHRIGQKADEVNADVYRHTSEFMDAIDSAVRKAQYVNGTLGADQKLLTCTCSFPLGDD